MRQEIQEHHDVDAAGNPAGGEMKALGVEMWCIYSGG